VKNKSKSLFSPPVLLVTLVILLAGCIKKEDSYIVFYPTEETVKDADGNIYHTVYIKGQTWMVENLKTTRYHNGDPIVHVFDSAIWRNLKEGAYCNYGNDSTRVKTYGRLYNWYAVNQGNLCPFPFHVPYDHDWQSLIDTVGGMAVAGGILKETGNIHWQNNTGATDQFGFTALPGGFRGADGAFRDINLQGYWWSYTNDLEPARSRSMNSGNTMVVRSEQNRESGFSVRCIRDY